MIINFKSNGLILDFLNPTLPQIESKNYIEKIS